MRYVLLALFSLFFVGCGSKSLVSIIEDKMFHVDSSKKIVALSIENLSQEEINLSYALRKGLKAKGYTIANDNETADYHLFVNILSVGLLERKSTTSEVLSNVNVNIGLGGTIGNVGVSTKVGSQIGKIFAKGINHVYQVVVDVSVDEYENERSVASKQMNLKVEGNLNQKPKEQVIYFVEEAISNKILEIF